MPIYEYQCLNNNHIFEEIQKFSDEPLQTCKICGGPVRKLISESSFHLKGSGWYVTDYKKNSGSLNKTAKSGDNNVSDKKNSDNNKDKEEKKEITGTGVKEESKEKKSPEKSSKEAA